MKLIDYLDEQRGRGAALAAALGVSPVMVSQWASGVKSPIPLERCRPIEAATEGAVTRRDLRPDDWDVHWPELVTPEFPAPKRRAAEPAEVR